jgi:hypothetical protein
MTVIPILTCSDNESEQLLKGSDQMHSLNTSDKSSMEEHSLSVVVPCYNEFDGILEFHKSALPPGWEEWKR